MSVIEITSNLLFQTTTLQCLGEQTFGHFRRSKDESIAAGAYEQEEEGKRRKKFVQYYGALHSYKN